MTVTGNVVLRNELCCERIRIEAELLPECQNEQKRRGYLARLKQIEYEIEQTYGDVSKQKTTS